MKYYFEGQLIRTSKTHHYAYALIKREDDGIVCIACSSTKAGAEKPKRDRIRELNKGIANAERNIKALEEGKSGVYSKGYGFVKFSEMHESCRTIEGNKEWIEDNKRCLAKLEQYEVVEIEER